VKLGGGAEFEEIFYKREAYVADVGNGWKRGRVRKPNAG
jgi:hypothetical protein